MRPLSAFAYIKGSVSKILPMVITVCLATAILYFLSLFLIKMDDQTMEATSYTMEHVSYIAGGKSGIPAEEIEKLKNQSGDVDIYPADFCSVVYKTIIGGMSADIYMLGEEDIKAFMKIEGFSLYKGRLPQNSSEIILHQKLAANYVLKVGSIIKKDTKKWYINEDLKVVGLFSGKGVMGISIEDKNALRFGLPYVSAVVAGKDIKRANEYIDKKLSFKYNVNTLRSNEEFMDKFNGPIDIMKIFVGVILVGVLGVFLANITSIQYSIRKKELELLYAVGYTRKYIIAKALREISIASLIGYVFGIILSLVLTWTLNICFLADKGLDMPLIASGALLKMLMVPAAITLFGMIAPVRTSKFRDLA